MQLFRRSLAITAVFGLAAASLRAQASGLPVYQSGIVRGITLALDGAIPNSAAGGGYAAGASVRAGIGLVGIGATVSRFDPSGAANSLWSGGATVSYKVFGGPLVPLAVTLQGGAGYATPKFSCLNPATCDVKAWHFPVGLGISWTIPNPALAIKPWIAPRLDVTRTSLNGSTNTDTHFALSGGVEFNLLNGMGLHAEYDWMRVSGTTLGIFGAGLHYNLRVPGL